MIDVRYSRALRDASYAWSQQRTIDSLTLQELRDHPTQRHAAQAQAAARTPSAAEAATQQPQLAQYGNLGTRLNLYA